MTKIIVVSVKVIVYAMFFTGIWLFLGKYLLSFFKKSSRYYRPGKGTKDKRDSKFIAHLRLLLLLTLGKSKKSNVSIFIFVSAFIFLLSFFILSSLFGPGLFFILVSVLLGSLPYIILRVKLAGLQLEGSYEAESLIAELTNMYRINSLNMAAAIDKTIFSLTGCPHSKKALFHLSLAIKKYRSTEELQYGIDSFVASTGTEWARLLGMNIFESVVSGTDVQVALDDILSELKEIKSIIERDRRANNEAFTMVKFVIPAVYVLSIYAANKFFGFTLQKFFNYQFSTALGIKFFMVIIALSIISFGAMFILRKPKFDY